MVAQQNSCSNTAVPGEQVMGERVVEKAKQEEEIEQIIPNNLLLGYFNNADQILNSNFILQKEKEKTDFENFKQEC